MIKFSNILLYRKLYKYEIVNLELHKSGSVCNVFILNLTLNRILKYIESLYLSITTT